MEIELSDDRSFIMKVISMIPGIRYKELQRITKMSNGVLSYNIAYLERNSLIKVKRDVRVTRFFPNEVEENETEIIGLLRENIRMKIVKRLLHEPSTYLELQEITKRSPSTLSWHLDKLTSAGIVSVTYRNRIAVYSIRDEKLLKGIIDKYGTLGRSVETFIDTWSEL